MSHNFLNLEPEFSSPETSNVFILPIPYDATVSYRPGARDGAEAIIKASCYLELYDTELKCSFTSCGLHTMRELTPETEGPEKMSNTIYKAAKEIILKNKFLVSLGGEHSISIGLVKAHAEVFHNLSVLQLDAHADLRDSYWGSKYSHASTMRRIIEMVPAVQVGIRSFSEEDVNIIQDKNLNIISAEEVLFSNNDNWLNQITDSLTQNVYITIDLDVFDPSVMPSTGTPEPGGLDWYRILKILKYVSARKKVIGFDVVELAPIPGNIAPDFLAAKLTYKMIGYSAFINYRT